MPFDEESNDIAKIVEICGDCCEMTFPDGTVYKGHFTDNFRNGTGITIYPNGDVYYGEHKMGKRTGEGIFITKNGFFQRGTFVEGILEGKGRQKLPTGEIHEANFHYGLAEGEGTIEYPTGVIQKVIFDKGQVKEVLSSAFTTGGEIEGRVKSGLILGYGKIRFEDETVFESSWASGKPYGNAIITFPNGENITIVADDSKVPDLEMIHKLKAQLEEFMIPRYVLKARYYHDGAAYDYTKKHTDGKTWSIEYPNGDLYVGEIKGGSPHGIGRMNLATGEIHEGRFERGELSGSGKKIINGIVHEGIWYKNTIKGIEIITYPDGRMEAILWKDGTPCEMLKVAKNE